jgi:hypothetical protein
VPAHSFRGDSRARTARVLLCAFFALAAAYFTLSTLCAIANFGWRQPMFDQWHEYQTLLGLPFPQNVLQEANGHRPVIPNLVRVAEIHWFAGDQLLQLGVGTLAEVLIVGLMAFAALRERRISPIARCAAVMLAVLGTLWLANARRLLHGSEALHGYLPILAAAGASYCTYLAHTHRSLAWLSLASLFCVLATFSFGLGVASFCSVLLLCGLLRIPPRWWALPLGALALSLVFYVFLLPGDQAIRQQVHLDLGESIWQTARWLSAPWMDGWLNSANTQSLPVGDPGTRLGRFVNYSAIVTVGALDSVGLRLESLSALLGLAGIGGFCAFVVQMYRKKFDPTRLTALATGLAAFALASAVITVAGRLDYLRVYPGQIYADRYLAWPTLFWACLTILSVVLIARSGGKVARITGTALLVALPIMLSATQRTGAIWGAIVYREAQRTAAQLLSGIYDRAHFPGVNLSAEEELCEIALLRGKGIAMFADPSWQRIGTAWTGSLESDSEITVSVHWVDPVIDSVTGVKAGHMEGWFTRGIARAQGLGQVVLLDRAGTIAGFAEYSFISPVADALILHVPRKRGFDGYVRRFEEGETYTLVLLDFERNRGIRLSSVAADQLSGSMHDSTAAGSGFVAFYHPGF